MLLSAWFDRYAAGTMVLTLTKLERAVGANRCHDSGPLLLSSCKVLSPPQNFILEVHIGTDLLLTFLSTWGNEYTAGSRVLTFIEL